MSKNFFASLFIIATGCFSGSVFAKLDFAVTCLGNGQSMVLVAEHDTKKGGELINAILTNKTPTFNRSELHLVSEDAKQFFYVEFKDWAGLNYDRDIFYFLDRDTLKLTKYSKFPKQVGPTKMIGTYSCKISADANEAQSQANDLFDKKVEEKESEKQRQLKKNKI